MIRMVSTPPAIWLIRIQNVVTRAASMPARLRGQPASCRATAGRERDDEPEDEQHRQTGRPAGPGDPTIPADTAPRPPEPARADDVQLRRSTATGHDRERDGDRHEERSRPRAIAPCARIHGRRQGNTCVKWNSARLPIISDRPTSVMTGSVNAAPAPARPEQRPSPVRRRRWRRRSRGTRASRTSRGACASAATPTIR